MSGKFRMSELSLKENHRKLLATFKADSKKLDIETNKCMCVFPHDYHYPWAIKPEGTVHYISHWSQSPHRLYRYAYHVCTKVCVLCLPGKLALCIGEHATENL